MLLTAFGYGAVSSLKQGQLNSIYILIVLSSLYLKIRTQSVQIASQFLRFLSFLSLFLIFLESLYHYHLMQAPDEEFEEYLRHIIGDQCTGDRNEVIYFRKSKLFWELWMFLLRHFGCETNLHFGYQGFHSPQVLLYWLKCNIVQDPQPLFIYHLPKKPIIYLKVLIIIHHVVVQ